jgi:ribonuclease J
MTKLIFYGGVNQIGGNKILLEDNGTKIFLDFGMDFNQAGKFFSEFLQPRKLGGIGDFLEFGLLPDLKGLYREDYLKHMGRGHEDADFQGVLLTHAHADHAAYIHHLREDIPIHCSEETHAILKALNDTASGSFTDLTELTRSFETYVNKKGEISKKTTLNHPEIVVPRKFNLFKFGKKFKIDGIEVIPYNVDHSLPGATGFIIHTSSGTIVYTDDFRFHGRREEATVKFMKACEKEKPDVLICEGTRIDEDSSRKEADVEDEVSTITSKSKGLTVCNWPVRDGDRMISFLNSAKKVNKKLTVSLKQAYMIEQLNKCKDSIAPKIDDKNLALYAVRKNWGEIGSDADERLIRADYDKWERNYLDDAICYKDVKDEQNKFMFFCSNFDLKELIDIRPVENSVYIKSVCEPFDVEMEIDWQRIENWVKHFGMSMNATHVSGHASGPQLKNFVKTVKPKMLIPVHTEHPNFYDKWWDNVHLLKNVGESVEIS